MQKPFSGVGGVAAMGKKALVWFWALSWGDVGCQKSGCYAVLVEDLCFFSENKWVQMPEELVNCMARLNWKINHDKKASRKFGMKFKKSVNKCHSRSLCPYG